MNPQQARESFEPGDVDRLTFELSTLERRLKDGEEKVRQAKQDGDRGAVDRWERAWIRLLHQYEATHDRLHLALSSNARSTGEDSSA
jgi:hypothetical protein